MAAIVALPAYGERKKVGVVLSGGGAKGVAHISALKAIEEAGIPIDMIAGTSMGAIIGGLYAIGYDTHTLDSMVRTRNWPALLIDRVPRKNLSFGEKENTEKYLISVPLTPDKGITIPSGITSGQNIFNLLTELTIGYNDSLDFGQFPIPFACVAYDMVDGESVTFTDGSLPVAMRASMSIPGAFTPIRRDGMVLVDGGIANNYPVNVARDMGAEIIIGIDLSSGLRKENQLNNMADIMDQLTNITAAEAREENIKATDLYIHPNMDGYSAASFSAADIDTLIKRGAEAMAANRDALLALKAKIGIPEDYEAEDRQTLEPDRHIKIRNIRFEGLNSYEEKNIRKLIGFSDNSEVSSSHIHTAMANLQGSGMFSSVSYRFDGKPPYDITFILKESRHNSLSFGFRFDTEEMAAVLLHAMMTPNNFGSTYLFGTARLSSNPYFRAGIATGSEISHQLSLSYTYRDNDVNLYKRGKREANMDYRQNIVDLSFSNIQIRNFKAEVGLRYEYFHYESQLSAPGSAHTRVKSEGLVNYYAGAEFESLNSRYYPTSGLSFKADYTLYTSDFATYRGYTPVSAIAGDFIAPLPLNSRVTLIPGAFTRILIGDREHMPYPALNFVGGAIAGRYVRQQLQFFGINHFELFQNALLGVKLDVRVGLWKNTYGSLKFNYMKHSDDFFEIIQGHDVFGGALSFSYDTIVGPLDVMLNWSNRDKKFGFYLNMGYYF